MRGAGYQGGLRACPKLFYSPATLLTLLLSLALHLFQVNGLPEGMPGHDDSPKYVKPASSMAPKYIDVLEQNSHIVYPALGVLTLMLVLVGIFQSLKSQDMDGITKDQFKRAIIHELRSNLSGLPGEIIARAIGLDRLKTVRLLEQMQQEGMVTSYMSSNQLMLWRMRGTGTDKKDKRY